MTLSAITSLDDLDPAAVAETQQLLSQLLQERHPELTLGAGVFHDLVLHFSAVCQAVATQTVTRLQTSAALATVRADPAAADPTVVDTVLSNFGVTRRQGSRAAGLLTFVFSDAISAVLSASVDFAAGGASFRLDGSFVGRPPGSIISASHERLLIARGDGTYAITLPATATTAGRAGNVRRGTQFATTVPLPRFVMAFAATDFANGANVESNASLAARAKFGVAGRSLSHRDAIVATLQEHPAFIGTAQFSIIGCGNAELQRDRHGIWPVSSPGVVDVYVRSQPLPAATETQLPATLIEKQDDRSIWQLAIPRDVAPGFYKVLEISVNLQVNVNLQCEILADLRGMDLSDPLPPLIETIEEAAYTVYQTAIIQFADYSTNVQSLALGHSQAYAVVLSSMPGLTAAQTICSDPQQRNLTADLLVRAPVPCDVGVACRIEQGSGTAALDVAAIQIAVADVVNSLDFPGQLHAAVIVETVQGFLSRRQAVAAVTLQGQVRQPDGQVIALSPTSGTLRLPELPSRMTTGRTTAFFLRPEDVQLEIVTTGFKETL